MVTRGPEFNTTFAGLTFTAFRYTNVPSPVRGLVIMSGSTIVDLMLNRTNGAALPNGSQFTVDTVVFDRENNQNITTNICTLAVGPAPGAPGGIPDGEISITPGPSYGRKIDGDAIVRVTRTDIWAAAAPPVLATRICVELWSEPSL